MKPLFWHCTVCFFIMWYSFCRYLRRFWGEAKAPLVYALIIGRPLENFSFLNYPLGGRHLTQGWFHVKSSKKIPDLLRFWWKLMNLCYPMTETCTHNFSPGWPLGSDLEVIIGHDFYRTLRQLNGHILCYKALKRLQQAPKCSELFNHWPISHKWLVTSKWPLTFKVQSGKFMF